MATRNIFFGSTASGKISYNAVSQNFSLGNSNTELITVASNTNVGIANVNPQYKLDVDGDVNTTGQYLINGIPTLSSTSLGSNIVSSNLTSVGVLDELTVANDVVVNGNMTVNGTHININTQNAQLNDSLIKQAVGNIADTVDIGSFGVYNDGTERYTGMFRDANDGKYKIFDNLIVEPTTVVDVDDVSYNKADLEVGDLEVENLQVNQGTTISGDLNAATITTDTIEINGLTSVSGDILPTIDAEFSLGTTGQRFKDLYLSGNSIYIDDVVISSEDGKLKLPHTFNINDGDMCVDITSHKVGVGIAEPTAKLHVYNHENTSEIKIESATGKSSVEIISKSSNDACVIFGNEINDQCSSLNYNYTTDTLSINTNNTNVDVDTNGLVVNNNIVTSNNYKINDAIVLSADSLGDSIVSSNIKALGIQNQDIDMGTNGITNISNVNLNMDTTDKINMSRSENIASGFTISQTNTNDIIFNNSESGTLSFCSNDIERLTIESSGDVNYNNNNITNINTLSSEQINTSNIVATNIKGMILDGEQPIITKVGNLVDLTTTGNITANTNQFVLDSIEENIGMGTNTPTAKLHIVRDSDNQADETEDHGLKIGSGINDEALMIGYDNEENIGYINAGSSGAVVTSLALQTRGGNVGIGKESPQYELDIDGSINIDGDIRQNGNIVAIGAWGQDENNIFSNNSGNVGIGTTQPKAQFEVAGVQPEIRLGNTLNENTANNNCGTLSFYSYDQTGVGEWPLAKMIAERTTPDAVPDGGLRFDIFSFDNQLKSNSVYFNNNGDVQNSTGVYSQTSDVRLKENIVDANSQWDDLKNLRIVNFNFVNDESKATNIGLIAQEVEECCPGLVGQTSRSEEINGETIEDVKYVKTSLIYMKMVKAFQESQTRIESLETENASLLQRLEQLEAKVFV